jgi:hypothetical protein
MAVRFGIVGLAVFLGLAGSVVASAQTAGTGTLVGRVMLCKLLPRALGIADRNPGPVIEAPPGGDERLPQSIRRAAVNVQVSIQGTALTAVTDAGGAFTLVGVPASQPLTVLAQLASGPPLVLDMPNLTVSPGQTLDLGMFGPAACNDGTAVLLPQGPVVITTPRATEVDVAPQPDGPEPTPPDATVEDPVPPADASD